MAARRHGMSPEARGLYTTEDYEARNFYTLVHTACDKEFERRRPESVLIEKEG